MNYYQHHIGDFDKATRHLTRLERSIYRDLIELYYDIERPLPNDLPWICRKIIANSNDEATCVERMLNEFFNLEANEGVHSRCENEIYKYHNSTSQKAAAGRASALKKSEKQQQTIDARSTNVEQLLNGCATNQEPITNNHKPITNKKQKTVTPSASLFVFPEGFPVDEWDAFVEMRKAAKKAMTDHAKEQLSSSQEAQSLFRTRVLIPFHQAEVEA